MSKNNSILDQAVSTGIRDRDAFDWENVHGAFGKLQEEVAELEEVLSQNDPGKTYEEFSDVFFTLLQVARHLNINPEKNLKFALEKYNLRYNTMSELIKHDDKEITALKLDELENYWQLAKKESQNSLDGILSIYLSK